MRSKKPALANQNQSQLVRKAERRILLIRGHRVMLDTDLAELYAVPTHRLNEQVRRNLKRFPPDFMFQLTSDEAKSLRSQFAISKKGRGGRRYAPLVFTEQGVAMLSSLLNSEKAVQVNIAIMRAFLKLREIFASLQDFARRLQELVGWQLVCHRATHRDQPSAGGTRGAALRRE